MVRIRLSRRGKTAAISAVARDIDFGHFWRQLKSAGWKAKRPSGLQTEWSYSSPEGAYTFVGEDAVVAHALETGLLDETPSAASTCDDGESATEEEGGGSGRASQSAVEEEGGGDVRASQIDTSVQLSQNTLTSLFGTPSDAEPELSPAAVTTAFDLSPSDLRLDASQRDAVASLQILSEVSGVESEGDEHREPAPAAVSAGRTQPQRTCVKKDVNYVAEDENTSEYESFSSGESDGVDFDADYGEPEIEGHDDNDEVLSDEDAVEMDEAFIESLRVGNNTLDKQAVKLREDALRATQWTPVSSDYETGVTAYLGLNMEEAQSVFELRKLCDSPLLSFFYFLSKSMWVMINVETNRYAIQNVDRHARVIQTKQVERRQESLKQIRRLLKAKPAYQTHEILHVIGLLIARMLCPQTRRFAAHWSMVEDGAVPAGNFGRFMGRNRCQDILRDRHFVDNQTDRTRDKLWKLRPVADKIQQRFLAGWSLPAVFSFDEGVLPSTSKRNTTRMLMSDKPHRYGSKLFMMCDSKTAYCYRFEVYAGKRNAGDVGDPSFDHKTGAAAVVRNLKVVLIPDDRHAWHAVVIDRFYSSILLAVELLGKNVYVIGTVMTKRLGYDQNIKDKRQSRPASIPRGSFTFSRSVAIPTMIAFHW